MNTRTRPAVARRAALAVIAVVTIAACSDSDSDTGDVGGDADTASIPDVIDDAAPTESSTPTRIGAGDGTTDAQASERDDSGPVVVEHRYGTTTLDTAPERIVSLDLQWTDVLTALDAPLVATTDNPYGGGPYPWQDVAGIDTLSVDGGIPLEAIAAQQPDLIVVTWTVTDEAGYEQLSAIAPTIPLLGDEQVDAWEDIAKVAGDVLRRPDDAVALVTESERQVAELRTALPGLDGTTYALANYVPGDAIYVVADPDDGASRLFAGLGMEIDPDLLAVADGASGRVTLSLENIGDLDADVLLILTNGTDPTTIPGYEALPAVRSGAVAVLEVEEVSGINTPTPLSIPYSLEFIRPALEAAAGR